jgi:hypothetical protein
MATLVWDTQVLVDRLSAQAVLMARGGFPERAADALAQARQWRSFSEAIALRMVEA